MVASGDRVPWETNDTPSTFGDLWTSKRGLKVDVVAVVVGLLWGALVLSWSLVNDCVCASVAHDFSIDLSGKHMPTKSYQKYGRNRRTDAFLWGGLFCKYCPAGSYGF